MNEYNYLCTYFIKLLNFYISWLYSFSSHWGLKFFLYRKIANIKKTIVSVMSAINKLMLGNRYGKSNNSLMIVNPWVNGSMYAILSTGGGKNSTGKNTPEDNPNMVVVINPILFISLICIREITIIVAISKWIIIINKNTREAIMIWLWKIEKL